MHQNPSLLHMTDNPEQLAEIARLRAMFRINALRWVPGISHAEIDALMDWDTQKADAAPPEMPPPWAVAIGVFVVIALLQYF